MVYISQIHGLHILELLVDLMLTVILNNHFLKAIDSIISHVVISHGGKRYKEKSNIIRIRCFIFPPRSIIIPVTFTTMYYLSCSYITWW